VLPDWESIDENLIRVNLNWMQRKITIIEMYTLSEDEKASTKDHFFAKFNEVIANIGSTKEY